MTASGTGNEANLQLSGQRIHLASLLVATRMAATSLACNLLVSRSVVSSIIACKLT